MARSAKRRGKKRPAKTRRTVRKVAKKRVAARRSKRKVSRLKAAKRAAAKRKPAKKRTPRPAPARRSEPWPMIFAVVIVLLVGLVAAWQFGGVTMAANAATYLPLAVADTAGMLAISDYGCSNAVAGDTWLMVAHPNLVPILR